MYCPKCGSKVVEDANFCKSCGANIKDNNSLYNYSNYISEEDLKKAFIGNNYEKIKEEKFSVPMFFLGAYYLFYRKMFLYAFLWIAMVIGINIGTLVYHIEYLNILPFICSIIMGIYFNRLYLKKVDKNIELMKQRNSNKSKQELLEECRKKGGVSVLAVILSITFITIVCFFILFGFIIDMVKENITESELKNKNNFNELQYTVPSIFLSDSYSSDAYKRFSYYDTEDSCSIGITNYKVYTNRNVEDYLKSSIFTSMDDQVGEVLSKNINGNVWKYVEVVSSNKTVYYYASIYNGRIYQIQYTISKDNNKLCSKGYNNFINSLIFDTINNSTDKI